MKKRVEKLELNKETLRQLNTDSLRNVQGGTVYCSGSCGCDTHQNTVQTCPIAVQE